MTVEKAHPKIAIISAGFAPAPAVRGGGVEQLVTKIVEDNEHEKFFDIDLFTIADELLDGANYKYTRVVQIRIPYFRNFIERVIIKLCYAFHIGAFPSLYGKKCGKIIDKYAYDFVIVENNMYAYKNIYKISKLHRNKLIFHLHNDIGHVDKPARLCRFIDRTALSVWTCSDFLKNRFKSVTRSVKVQTLSNAINFEKFHFDARAREKIRRQLGFSEANFVFAYIGRIAPEKGVLELVRAFGESQRHHPGSRLLIIGDISHKSKYVQKVIAETTMLKDKVSFIGRVDNDKIPQYISCADCVVVPTICQEAFGLVAAEAMACRKMVITSGSGGLMNIISNDTAIIVALSDTFMEDLSRAMSFASSNPEKMNIMGKNGYKRISHIDEVDDRKYIKNFKRLLECCK